MDLSIDPSNHAASQTSQLAKTALISAVTASARLATKESPQAVELARRGLRETGFAVKVQFTPPAHPAERPCRDRGGRARSRVGVSGSPSD